MVSSLNPSKPGQSITFTVNVIGAGAIPTGTITLKDGANTLATVGLTAGVAQFATSTLALGQHFITALYSGDSIFAGSLSGVLTQMVNFPTTTTLSASAVSVLQGQPVTFTASVTAMDGQIPAGTVEFFDSSTSLGTANLNHGVAILTSTSLGTGHHSVIAVYNGNSTFGASTSPVLPHPFVMPLTDNRVAVHSMVVTSSAALVNLGSPVTFTVTITPLPGTVPVPSGAVHFFRVIVAGIIGSSSTLLGTAAVVNGQAAFTVTLPASGTYNIRAVYGGDTVFRGGTSPLFQQLVH